MYYLRLRDLREDKDLKQIDIAKKLNVSQQQYSRLEKEINQLSYENLIILAIFYNTSVDYILGITNKIEPYPKIK